MKILITGFDAFGGNSVNPSWEAVKQLPDRIDDKILIKQLVPTVFYRSAELVTALIDEKCPDAVVCVGLASGRRAVSIERVAINCIDARRCADNAGKAPLDEKVISDGPAAYFSTLPIRTIESAIIAEGIACEISNTAGTFVCNALMYSVLHHIETEGSAVRAGFIHVPGTDNMEPSALVKALECAVRAL